MACIGSVGLGIPDHEISQNEAKQLARSLFSNEFGYEDVERLLTVFDHAEVHKRQLVVGLDWFNRNHTFKERNDQYSQVVLQLALEAIDYCLNNSEFLQEAIPEEAIDLIVFVSSTGVLTPSMDVHILNERSFREDITRMPLWGLGCAGGASGLAMANDWLEAHPDKNAIVVCAETASLTFQHNDKQKSNLIGTALFGDGVGAALLMGDSSKFKKSNPSAPNITDSSSYTVKETMDVMGWNVVNDGFEVVFSKEIPELIHSVWHQHVQRFLKQSRTEVAEVDSFIVHPGGKKVLDAMEETFVIPPEKLVHSREVLKDHGNMSSATVLYVLKRWMLNHDTTAQRSVLSALGPGFTSELLSLEWD